MLPILLGTFTLSSSYTYPSEAFLPPQSQPTTEIQELVEEEVQTEEQIEPVANPATAIQTREEVVSDNVSGVTLHPNLVPICKCESGLRQYNPDGTVLRGVINPQDVGICQINLKYHGQAAEDMGLDLFTLEGNITYANRLYASEGATPWGWSAGCHGQY